MKLWASASAIGLSMASVLAACSSSPPDTTPPNTSAGAPAGGSTPIAGGPAVGGGGTSAGGNTSAGAQPVAGAAGAAGAAGGGTAGAGGTAMGEGPCPMVGGKVVDGHCDAGVTLASYPTYPGYTLNLVEDFPAAMELDTDPIFTWSDGSPADGQTRFRKQNIVFANGKMAIKAESPCPAQTGNSMCIPGGTPNDKSFAEPDKDKTTGTIGNMGVWSGEFRTRYNNYRYGRYEAKFRAPIANPGMETVANDAGGFLSTLFIFRSPKWSIWNEIDIELEGSIPTSLAGNVLNVAGRTGYPGDVNNAFVTTMGLPAGYKNVDEHVYAFTWTPTSIDWFVDGQPARSFKGGAATAGMVAIPTVSAKIMMNLWVFSGTPFGKGANNKYPMQAEYEYFRFYKLDTETKYPCSPTPACLDAADKSPSAQNNPTEMNYGM